MTMPVVQLYGHIIETHVRATGTGTSNHKVAASPSVSDSRAPDTGLSRRATLAIAGTGIIGVATNLTETAAGQSATEITNWNELKSELQGTNAGDEFVLVNNLDENTAGYSSVVDPNGGTFEPISSFAGRLDGQGNEIADLVIDRTDPVGLFGNITGDGEVTNLSLADATVTNRGGDFEGGGILAGENAGTITNVSASGTVVTEGSDTGGIVGINEGTINGSEAHVHLSEPQPPSNVSQIGGLAGTQQDGGTIENSFATGDVLIGTDDRIGGLVGSNGQFGVAKIINSHATGDVEGNDSVGGLAGDVQSSDSVVSGSHATGSVTGDGGEIGGLVGDIFRGDTIENSYATGDVTGTAGADGLGGLVGTVSDTDVTISGCHASGSVTGNGGSNQVGGFVGSNGGATITAAFAEGDTTGTDNVGGLAGENVPPFSGTSVIQESAATGSVNGSSHVGGVVGTNEETIRDCYALGAITGDDEVGGFAGNNTGSITSSYAAGSVSGTSNVGGFIGFDNGTNSGSYWDTETSGQNSSAGNATGRTTDQMQGVEPTEQGNNTMSGLAFDRDGGNTWFAVVGGEQINPTPPGDGYPILQEVDAGDQLDVQEIEQELGLGDFEVVAITDETPTEVGADESFRVQYTVENVGEETGRQSIRLAIDGTEVANKPDTLTAGQSVTNSFTDITLPEDAAPGDTVELTVRTNNDAQTQNLTITGVQPPVVTVADYANENGVVEITGVTDAIGDWQSGDIGISLVSDVIAAWQSGEPVT